MTTETPASVGARSPFIPVLLLAVALLGMLTFQTIQIYRDGDSLQELKVSQEQPLEEARRLRTQLDGVAADTARLSEQGNPNAQRVVDELRKRGVTINPNATVTKPPAE